MKNIIVSVIITLVLVFFLLYADNMGIIQWDAMPGFYRVPDFVGLKTSEADIICRIKGLYIEIEKEEYSDAFPEGVILSQYPEMGELSALRTISVLVSAGQPTIHVPDLMGMELGRAADELRAAMLEAGTTSWVFSDLERGRVISTDPPADAMSGPGEKIDILLSKGKDVVYMPNLIGKKLPQAQELLKERDLVIGYLKKETDTEHMFGVVLRQHPSFGKKVERNTAVTIVINEEEE